MCEENDTNRTGRIILDVISVGALSIIMGAIITFVATYVGF